MPTDPIVVPDEVVEQFKEKIVGTISFDPPEPMRNQEGELFGGQESWVIPDVEASIKGLLDAFISSPWFHSQFTVKHQNDSSHREVLFDPKLHIERDRLQQVGYQDLEDGELFTAGPDFPIAFVDNQPVYVILNESSADNG